jgi:hypothetical protein
MSAPRIIRRPLRESDVMNYRGPDLTGQCFGRLAVVGRAPRDPSKPGRSLWICRCDCGSMAVVLSYCLSRGHTRSCGCLNQERRTERLVRQSLKHGHTRNGHRHPLYSTWSGMRSRCNDSNSARFPLYGARGIRVSERWDDFTTFIADVGPKPSLRHSLDRIDNEGDYEPSNVRWATPHEQRVNQRPVLPKSHCRRGHLKSGENLYLHSDGTRECRTCKVKADHEGYERRKRRWRSEM